MMPVTPADVERILADPERTREIVEAAARALNSMDVLDADPHYKDGQVVLAGKSVLRTAFTDFDAIRKALS